MASEGDRNGDHGPVAALSPKVTRAFSATFVLFCLDRAFQLGILAILARALSPAQFGVAAAATMFVSIATQLFQVGMGPALIQASDLTSRALATARTLIFTMAIVCFCVIEAAAPFVAVWFRAEEVTDAVRVLAVICLINGISLIPHSNMIRSLRARDVGLVDLGCGLLGNGIVAAPLALMGYGYWALICGTIVQVAAKAVGVEFLTRLPWQFGLSSSDARQLWFKGVGFSLTLLLHRISLESDRLIVGRFLNTTALGLYSRANGLMALPSTMYGAVVDRVVFPAFSQVQGDIERIQRGYSHALSMTALMGGSLSVFLVFEGPDIIRFVLGPAWEGAIAPFNILCAAIYFRLSDRVSGTLLRGCGRPYLMACLQTISALVTVAGCLLAYRFGISGVAAAVVAGAVTSYLLMTAVAVHVVRLGLKAFALSQVHGLATSLLIAVVLFLVRMLAEVWDLSSFVSLGVAGLMSGAALIAAAALAPRVFLGAGAHALLQSVLANVLVVSKRA